MKITKSVLILAGVSAVTEALTRWLSWNSTGDWAPFQVFDFVFHFPGWWIANLFESLPSNLRVGFVYFTGFVQWFLFYLLCSQFYKSPRD
jgi:hypothetical protein